MHTPLPRFLRRALPALALLPALLSSCLTRGGWRPLPAQVSLEQHVRSVPDHGEYQHTRPDGSIVEVPGRATESLEKYGPSGFWLGHVEMTEYGTYQDHHQMDVIERAVERESQAPGGLFRKGVSIVVFVHGWFNNAEEHNDNLNHFRDLLAEVAASERKQDRGVLGVYLSWRGAATDLPGVKFFSYWNRARVADTIGQGIMVEALARIRNVQLLVAHGAERSGGRSQAQVYGNSRLVLIGHSFGGRALYDATAPGVEDTFLRPYWAARSFPQALGRGRLAGAAMRPVTGPADLVLLINPAIKGLPYRKLHYAVHTNATVDYAPRQTVLMMVLSAENDWPNKDFLPAGETLGNHFRDWFARHPQDAEPARQNTTALGHWPLFHSHKLSVGPGGQLTLRRDEKYFKPLDHDDDGQPYPAPLPVKTLRYTHPIQGVNTPGDPGLLPCMIVSTSSQIIDGHSGFWPQDGNRRAVDFVAAFIAAQNRAVTASRGAQAATAQEKVMPPALY